MKLCESTKDRLFCLPSQSIGMGVSVDRVYKLKHEHNDVEE
jgi:hypothetical protein